MNKVFVTCTLTVMLFFAYQLCAAQQVSYAKEVISKLCSESMKGRGYVDRGDENAANFLASQFEKKRIKKIFQGLLSDFYNPREFFSGKNVPLCKWK